MTFVLDCLVTMAWVFPDEASEATDRGRESMIEGRAFVSATSILYPFPCPEPPPRPIPSGSFPWYSGSRFFGSFKYSVSFSSTKNL